MQATIRKVQIFFKKHGYLNARSLALRIAFNVHLVYASNAKAIIIWLAMSVSHNVEIQLLLVLRNAMITMKIDLMAAGNANTLAIYIVAAALLDFVVNAN